MAINKLNEINKIRTTFDAIEKIDKSTDNLVFDGARVEELMDAINTFYNNDYGSLGPNLESSSYKDLVDSETFTGTNLRTAFYKYDKNIEACTERIMAEYKIVGKTVWARIQSMSDAEKQAAKNASLVSGLGQKSDANDATSQAANDIISWVTSTINEEGE